MSLLAHLLLAFASAAPVHGTVREAGSGEPVAYAVVEVGDERQATADARGYFFLPGVPAGRQVVRVRALGYRPLAREVDVPATGALAVEFALTPAPFELPGLKAEARRRPQTAGVPGPAPTVIDRIGIDLMPPLAEPDVLRAVQALPAVQAASDFSTALYVRGGSPDQNLVLLDGAPLFNPFHLGGVFAAVDPDAVANLEVWPGGLPARIGDRLSSHVAIHTRDGGRDRLRGRGAIGMLSARASVDGPLFGPGSSYLVSARRTYLDVLSRAAAGVGLIERGVPYGFSDAHVKLTHDVGVLGRASASLYVNDEALVNASDVGGGEDRFAWGTRAASLSYRQPLGGTLLLDARLGWTDFHSGIDVWELVGDSAVPTVDARVRMRAALAAVDATWYTENHRLHLGFQADRYRFDYRIAREAHFFSELFPPLDRASGVTTLAAYLEDEWRPTDRLSLRLGLRALGAGDLGTVLMPRAGARWALGDRLAVSLAGGRYAQAVTSIRDDESLAASLLAYDLLDAATPATGLPTAHDLVFGAHWRSGGTAVDAHAYVKEFRDLRLPPLPPDPFDAPVLVAEGFRRGSGSARGLELRAAHEAEDWGATLSYTLSSAERTAGADRFTPRFHRTHLLDVLAHHELGVRGRLSARLAWGSGQPYTAAIGLVQPLANRPADADWTSDYRPTVLLGRHNAERLPGYFRLDVAARWTAERRWFGRRVTLTPYAQVLNVLNTRNVLTAEPDPFGTLVSPTELKYPPQLPILPSIGLEWRF